MSKKNLLILATGLILLAGAGIGVFLYFSKDAADINNSGESIDQKKQAAQQDRCQKFYNTRGKSLVKDPPSDDEAMDQDASDMMVDTAKREIQELEDTVAKGGVDIPKEDLCAYKLVEDAYKVENPESASEGAISYLIDPADLTGYMSKGRASAVVEWIRRTESDEIVMRDINRTVLEVIICSDDNQNRISEPSEGKVICENPSGEIAIDQEVWPSLDYADAKWGGCPFEISREDSTEVDGVRYGGSIKSFKYCATFSSGALAVCTFDGCEHE